MFGKPTLIGGFFRFYKINLFEYQLIKNNFVYINIFVYFCRQQKKINMKTTENLKTIDQKDKKIKDLEIELEVYVNHSKFLENQTAKQSIEIRELEAEIRNLKDRIDANNKHTLQLLDTQKRNKSFYI